MILALIVVAWLAFLVFALAFARDVKGADRRLHQFQAAVGMIPADGLGPATCPACGNDRARSFVRKGGDLVCTICAGGSE